MYKPFLRRRGSVHRENAGVTHLLPTLVALTLLVGSTGVVMLAAVDRGEHAQDKNVDSQIDVTSERLAETLVATPGNGWYSTVACSDGLHVDVNLLDPEAVQRFGLGAERCPLAGSSGNALDFAKLQTLVNAQLNADPTNGNVDYEEARAALGLTDSRLDFHLRTWPLLAEARQVLEQGSTIPNLRPVYVGDYEEVGSGEVITYAVEHVCGYTQLSSSVSVWVDLTNNGSLATAFEVQFTLPLEDGTVQWMQHSVLVGALGTKRVEITLPKANDWDWDATPQVTVRVSDTVRQLGLCTIDLSGANLLGSASLTLPVVYAEGLSEALLGGSTSAKVYYDAYDGSGSDKATTGWKLVIKDSLGLPVATDTSLDSRGWESFTLLLPGVYTIQLQNLLGQVLASDKLHIVSLPLSPFTPLGAESTTHQPQPSVLPEATYVQAIAGQFVLGVFDPDYESAVVAHVPSGDVVPDYKHALDEGLVARIIDDQGTGTPNDDVPTLDTYNVLVIGSNVDQNALTSAGVKYAIRDWVLAGGYLMVLGSDQSESHWLEPVFNVALQGAGGGIGTPDSGHPLLGTPNGLDYLGFENHGQAWSYSPPENAESFTHVVVAGSDDVLAASNPGAFGDGRILLTAWAPYNLTGTGATGDCAPASLASTCQGLQFIHNALTLSFLALNIDYGPPLPSTGSTVGSSGRVATVYHPELEVDVEIGVQLYVFG